MYRRHNRKPQVRTITVKYAGPCHCCGAEIKPGELADYFPVGTIAGQTKAAIAHMGGLDGTSPRCNANIARSREFQPDASDIAYEDMCASMTDR